MGRDRAQSGVDFVIGFGVFFLTFSFVVVLLPELLSPFAGQEGAVLADRGLHTLSGNLLASGTAGSLNGTCTEEFFAGAGQSCGFDAGDPTTAIVGLSTDHSVNVTVERKALADAESEIACYDGTAVVDCSAGGTPLARGKSPPDDSVRTIRRVVALGGEPVSLTLRVW